MAVWQNIFSLQSNRCSQKKQTVRQCTAIVFSYQKFVLVLGLEHGGHLLKVETVSLLLQLWGEENGDYPLGDVGQVKVIVALHHSVHNPIHTEASDRGRDRKRQTDEVGFLVGHREKGGCVSKFLNIKLLLHLLLAR